MQTNVIGTSVLPYVCHKYGIKRYHQVSTDEVYGDLPLYRPDLFFMEMTNLHTSQPLFGIQGFGGFIGDGLSSHIQGAGDHFQLIK